MIKKMVGMGIITCLYVQVAAADVIYYVHSELTRIYEKPSLSSRILGEASRGQSFSGLEETGNWVKIKLDSTTGFVSAFAVRTSPPQQKSGIIVSADNKAQPGARARASSAQAIVAGVKGLTYEGRTRASKSEGVNFDDLELMESVRIEPAELKSFAPGGGQ